MKLRDFLKTMNDDATVAIGAKSAYMFVGPVRDAQEIERAQSVYIQRLRASLKRLESFLSNATPRRLVEHAHEKGGTFKVFRACKTDADRYRAAKNYIAQQYGRRETTLSRLNEQSVSFLDREVKEVWLRPVADNIGIRVEGSESGFFWDEEEYTAWKLTGVLPSDTEKPMTTEEAS